MKQIGERIDDLEKSLDVLTGRVDDLLKSVILIEQVQVAAAKSPEPAPVVPEASNGSL